MAGKGEWTLRANINMFCDSRLKEMAGEEANKRGIPLSEFVSLALASFLRKPELAKVPRKAMGRPRKTVSSSDQIPA